MRRCQPAAHQHVKRRTCLMRSPRNSASRGAHAVLVPPAGPRHSLPSPSLVVCARNVQDALAAVNVGALLLQRATGGNQQCSWARGAHHSCQGSQPAVHAARPTHPLLLPPTCSSVDSHSFSRCMSSAPGNSRGVRRTSSEGHAEALKTGAGRPCHRTLRHCCCPTQPKRAPAASLTIALNAYAADARVVHVLVAVACVVLAQRQSRQGAWLGRAGRPPAVQAT